MFIKEFSKINFDNHTLSIDKITDTLPKIGEIINCIDIVTQITKAKYISSNTHYDDLFDYNYYVVEVTDIDGAQNMFVYAVPKNYSLTHKCYNSNFEIFFSDLNDYENTYDYLTIKTSADDLLYYTPENYDTPEEAFDDFINDIAEALSDKFCVDILKVDGWESLKISLSIYCKQRIEFNFETAL